MKRAISIILGVFAILAAAGLGTFFFLAPAWVEDALNGVENPPPYAVSDEARALHRTLVVADLHADPLLWGATSLSGARAAMSTYRASPRAT